MKTKRKLFQGTINNVCHGTQVEATVIPTKTKTPLMFTWIPGLGKDMMVQVGNYSLYVSLQAGFWHWQIYHNGKVISEGRKTGWRRQSTAQHQAELHYHKYYGKTST